MNSGRSSPPRKKSKTVDVSMSELEGLDAKDLDRFSRQNAALGAETTAKLIKMKVVVVGVRGVGIETCKNLMLQGVGALTIIDQNPCAMADVGVNFFISEVHTHVHTHIHTRVHTHRYTPAHSLPRILALTRYSAASLSLPPSLSPSLSYRPTPPPGRSAPRQWCLG